MAKTPKKVKQTDPKIVQAKLGARIREMRKAKGYTSALKFAIDYEFSHVQMARWEQGANLRLDTLIRLADAFDVTLAELFKDL
jgi:transcriptional regulator with XRE-family HTH domain